MTERVELLVPETDPSAGAATELVGALGAGVVLHDLAGRLRWVDDTAAALLDLPCALAVGRTWHDPAWGAVHEDGRPLAGHEHPVMLSLGDGDTRHGDVVGLTTLTGVRWLRFDVTALHDGSVAALVTDVTHEVQRRIDGVTELTRTRRLLAPARDVVVRVSRRGRIVAADAATEDVLGRSPESLLGCSLVELVTSADRPAVRDAFDTLAVGATAVLRVRVRRRGGERRWTRLGMRWLDPDMAEAHVVLADEHEAVVAAAQAAELDERLAAVSTSARDTVALHSAEGRFTWVSARCATDLGWRAEDLLGMSLHDLVHPEDVARVDAAHGLSAAGQQPVVRFRCRGADEQWRLVECELSGVLDRSTGRLLELRSVTRAAAPIVLAEQQLAMAEELFRRGFDSSPTATALLGHDASGIVRWQRVNDALVDLLGRARGSLHRLSPEDLVVDDGPQGTARRDMRSALASLLAGTREVWKGRVVWVHPTGARVPASVTATAVLTAEGSVAQVVLHTTALDTGPRSATRRLRTGGDELTSLPDRALALDRLVNALQRSTRSGRSVAVAAVSLDGLQELVDRHGQPAGDSVVVEVVSRLAATLRVGDTLARVGDHGFLVVCEDLDELAVSRVAARLSSSGEVAAPGTPSGRVSAAVGCATRPCAGTEDPARVADELLGAAESAAHQVRARGGGGWQLVKHTFT